MDPAAAEARALADRATVGALATISLDDGHPWASLVAYAMLDDGSPVLCLSRLAEHGANVEADARASLMVAEPDPGPDPLDAGRATLAGRVHRPAGDEAAAARAAYLARVPSAAAYIDFDDFSLWVLTVERIRWVGGYGRMGWA
jgi:heme iron utilization protein